MKKPLAEIEDNARVWIYQADRQINPYEEISIGSKLDSFVQSWDSHGIKVHGHGAMYYNTFIVLIAEETEEMVSGCSIDSSVRLIKQIGDETGIDFFNRLNIAYLKDEQVHIVHRSEIDAMLRDGRVSIDTPIFNNLVISKKEFDEQWMVPLGESWVAR